MASVEITLIFLLISFFDITYQKKAYSIKTFRIENHTYNESLWQVSSCMIKAVRGKNGIINCITHYEGIKDLWILAQIFYRGTSGRYQPFLLNVDINVCDLTKFAASNKLFQIVFKIFDKFDPTLKDGCPLKGPLIVSNFDFEAESSWIFPPIIPGIFLQNFLTVIS